MTSLFFHIDGTAYEGYDKEIWDAVVAYLKSRGNKKLRAEIFATLDRILDTMRHGHGINWKPIEKTKKQEIRFRLEQKLERLTNFSHPKHRKEWLRILGAFPENHRSWWRAGCNTLEEYLESAHLREYDDIKALSPFAEDDLCFPKGLAEDLRKGCFEDYRRFLQAANSSKIEIKSAYTYALVRSKDRKKLELVKL
jgi:hypothetical protein